MKTNSEMKSDYRTQKEYKSYAEVAKNSNQFFWLSFCDLCETFATSASGCPLPHLES